MIADKYAILYVTSTVCECVSLRNVLQDNTEYCSDLKSSQALGFEIDFSDHRLFSF